MGRFDGGTRFSGDERFAPTRWGGLTGLLNPAAAVFSRGESGFWIPTSTSEYLYSDAGQTTNVVDGGSIASADDASGNDNDAAQATSGSRPTYDETAKAIQFDGQDDSLPIAGLSGLTDNMTFMCVVNTTDTNFMMLAADSGTAPYAGFVLSGSSANVTSTASGDVTYYVDGVRLFNPTRNDLFEAIADGQNHVVQIQNLDMTDAGYAVIELFFSSNYSREFNGLIGNPILTSNTDPVAIAATERWIAAEHDVALLNTMTIPDILALQTKSSFYASTALNDMNMYQDTGAVTPADADGDPVALVLTEPEVVGVDIVESDFFDQTFFDEGSSPLPGLDWRTIISRVDSANGVVRIKNDGSASTGRIVTTSNGVSTPGDTWRIRVNVLEHFEGNKGLQFGVGSNSSGNGGDLINLTSTSETGILERILQHDPSDASGQGHIFLRSSGGSNTDGGFSFDSLTIERLPHQPLLQSTSGSRPTVDAASGLLEFDGTDDYLTASLLVRGDNAYVGMVLNRAGDDFMVLCSDLANNPFLGVAQDGSTDSPDTNVGNPRYSANGATVTPDNRQALYDAVPVGEDVFLEASAVDFSNPNAASVRLLSWFTGPQYSFNGLAGFFILLGDDPGVVLRNRIREIAGQAYQIPELGYSSNVDTTAPTISDSDYDDTAKRLDITADEGGTLYWATWDSAGATPDLNTNGTWTNAPLENGSYPVSDPATTTTDINYDDTASASADRLSFGIIDAAGNVSTVQTITFTP